MGKVNIKRAYEAPSDKDGYRILVDRIWPRGISKEKAKLDEWCKDIAPSTELRKWFGHKPEKFKEFSERYQIELKEQKADLSRIEEIAKENDVCLVYGAKDEIHNQAVVLQKLLETGNY